VKPPIALLTDFGLADAYVGAMKGAMLARDPAATLVDLSHAVPPGALRRAAFLLAISLEAFPAGTIFLVVVDPGVGTARRAVAVEAADWRLVGPDNGVLTWALRFLAREGRVAVEPQGGQLALLAGARAVELTERRFWRPRVSRTFHGRDLFGPVAAELGLGRPLAEFGPALDRLTDLAWPEPGREAAGAVRGEVLSVDTYGNLITNLRLADLPAAPRFELAGRGIAGLSEHFQSPAPLLALDGSSGFIEIAVPNGSAARLLGAAEGLPVRVVSER
jgi:S-adenosylmethionine hydrolase